MRQILARLRRRTSTRIALRGTATALAPKALPTDHLTHTALPRAVLPPPVGQRLRRCMETTPAPHGGPWTVQEVAEAAAHHAGGLEQVLLRDLLEGTCTDVDQAQLQVLAATFAVPPQYFLGSGDQVDAIDAQLELMQALRDSGARIVCPRLRGGQSTEMSRSMAAMLRSTTSGQPTVAEQTGQPATTPPPLVHQPSGASPAGT